MPLTRADTVELQSLTPVALSLSTIPSKLPADNNTYPAVVVTIVDKNSRPTVALRDTEASLTSSQENVGRISPTVDIPAGQTYAIANFTTTNTAGSTTVTATTTGLTTAGISVTTVVAVGYPTHLAITAIPATAPARPSNTGNLIMELEDAAGLPAKAIADTTISLYSSNTNVVNVTAGTTTMMQGEYLKEIDYTSGYVPGSAEITASAPGFNSGTATISVSGSPPLGLKLLAQPSSMVACSANVTSCEGRLVVALTDLTGNPARATRDIQVQIRSSDLAVVNASQTATIKAGNIESTSNYRVLVTSVGKAPFLVTVTASSPGLQSSFASITIVDSAFVSPTTCTSGPSTTCQLQMYAGPNPVLADHRSYSSVVVQLEATQPGGGGLSPAVNVTGTTEVTLTSSVTGIGNFTRITFTIPKGQTWAAVDFTSTFQVGSTQLTASAQNFLPAQSALATYGPVPSQVVVSAITSTLPADGAPHPALELALEDSFGSPAVANSSLTVSLTSSRDDIIHVADAVIPGGQTFAVVNVTAGILQGGANVTARASSFAASSANLATVIPAPSSLGAFAPDGNKIMVTPGNGLPLVAVQLEGAGNAPARARAPMNISVTSSNSTLLPKVLTASVSVGQDYVVIPVSPLLPGSTTLTFSSPGLSVASLQITFLPYPSQETITGGPAHIFTNQTAIIVVSLTLDGAPLAGATVHWNVTSGGLILPPRPTNSSSTITTVAGAPTVSSSITSTRTSTAQSPTGTPTAEDTTDKTGSSTTVFKPTKPGSALILATVVHDGLPTKTLNFTVAVTAPPVPLSKLHPKPSLIQQFTSFPLLLVPIGAVGGGGAAAFFLIRRRGKGGGGDEDFDNALE